MIDFETLKEYIKSVVMGIPGLENIGDSILKKYILTSFGPSEVHWKERKR